MSLEGGGGGHICTIIGGRRVNNILLYSHTSGHILTPMGDNVAEPDLFVAAPAPAPDLESLEPRLRLRFRLSLKQIINRQHNFCTHNCF